MQLTFYIWSKLISFPRSILIKSHGPEKLHEFRRMVIPGVFNVIKTYVFLVRPFLFNRAVETCNFDPLTLIQFSNGFLYLTL